MLVIFDLLVNLRIDNLLSYVGNIFFFFEIILICVHVQRFETVVTSAI